MTQQGWDFDTSNGGGTKAEFTKFPVGITRIRVLDDAPHVRWTHWLQQHKRSVNCPGQGCPICEIRKQQKANKEPYTYPMGRRFAMNNHNIETGKVEIMEQGIGFFEDLRDLKADVEEKGNKLHDAILKVRRRGTGKDDTSYRIDVDEIMALSLDEIKKLDEQKIDLKEYFKPHTNEQILRVISGEAWDVVMKSENADENNGDGENEEIEIR